MKAYWIAHVDVDDAEHYSQYTQRAPAAFADALPVVPTGHRITARFANAGSQVNVSLPLPALPRRN